MLLTRPPLDQKRPKAPLTSFDLHVLRTPPAFVLSQDQTRHPNFSSTPPPPPLILTDDTASCSPQLTIVCAIFSDLLVEAFYSIAHKGSLVRTPRCGLPHRHVRLTVLSRTVSRCIRCATASHSSVVKVLSTWSAYLSDHLASLPPFKGAS